MVKCEISHTLSFYFHGVRGKFTLTILVGIRGNRSDDSRFVYSFNEYYMAAPNSKKSA